MPEYVVEHFFSNAPDRNTVRMRVVNRFSEEPPGTGRGRDASRFTYYVETVNDGRRVYLRRPANLHNGFDFAVHVERTNFNRSGTGRARSRPSHDDIITDLRAKKATSPIMYQSLFQLLERIYNCEDIDFALGNDLIFNIGYPCDLILASVKWLLIEQDIRYWNYSGRDMFWSEIQGV